jgi:hypothetical protein
VEKAKNDAQLADSSPEDLRPELTKHESCTQYMMALSIEISSKTLTGNGNKDWRLRG